MMGSYLKSRWWGRELALCFTTLAAIVLSVLVADAQPTSRIVPFGGVATTLPPNTTQTVRVELWDQAVNGTRISFEDQPDLVVDANSLINFNWGSTTSLGLLPEWFPSGSSRF